MALFHMLYNNALFKYGYSGESASLRAVRSHKTPLRALITA